MTFSSRVLANIHTQCNYYLEVSNNVVKFSDLAEFSNFIIQHIFSDSGQAIDCKLASYYKNRILAIKYRYGKSAGKKNFNWQNKYL